MSESFGRSLHLVFGADGQLGFELARALAPRFPVIGLTRLAADLSRPETVAEVITAHRPGVIWNAAAATAVDALESDVTQAFRVNAESVGVMAESARRVGSILIHFSTDYVFDGTKSGMYTEDDVPSPLNVYGKSKLAGEQAVAQAGGRWLVLRTSWLYSTRGRNFLRTIARRGMEVDRLRVVDDQFGAPTAAPHLADAASRMVVTMVERGSPNSGVYHLTAGGETTWWGFACAIRDELTSRGAPWKARLEAMKSAELGLPARRPVNSRLSSDRFLQTFGFALSEWREMLSATVSMGSAQWWCEAESPSKGNS